MEIVLQDLTERNIPTLGMSDGEKQKTLELVLREEEEWERMAMYREVEPEDFTLKLDRTVLDMLHRPMRMHEKILICFTPKFSMGRQNTRPMVHGKQRRGRRR